MSERSANPLPTPGRLGRAIRLAAGLAELSLLIPLFTLLRVPMWAGELPLRSVFFYMLLGLTVWLSSWVIRILVDRPWGQKPVLVLLAGAAVAAGAGYATAGTFDALPLNLYLWAWFTGFILVLGPAHVLSAIFATPGCEMRVYAQLLARLQGDEAEVVACPAGIDRFDHIGSPDPQPPTP